ncbi:ATP-dependent zinc metalloprotease YME1 homolog isoform X1 [Cephus cinctus]|uniref:ATP-dependent zinc metalloprotease YME1 homolog isoform X1 n=1 Tax=Cephus cinctus TaxID=211228 RepID=A0AAJ7FL82_CEPCN|nr:ATP-dependent zinc metalloprotease YME1 homolog isoform X1 [Cephus cinctus]
MISLQSYNQVLYHLTQLTSTVTPRPSRFATTVKHHDKINRHPEVLCQNSLTEAAKNCTELYMERLNTQHLATPLRIKRNDAYDILKQLSKGLKPTVSRIIDKNSKWRVSYISGASFIDNKYGFPHVQFPEPTLLPMMCLSSWQPFRLFKNMHSPSQFAYDMQIRSFKTDRSAKVDRERNPTLGGRFRKWMGMTSSGHQEDRGMITGASSEHAVEKLRTLLSDHEMSTDEQQRVKVAFAEGYMAGHGKKTPDRTLKWLKVVQHVVMIGIFLTVFISFMASASGSMFRIQIGNQVEVDPEEIHVTFNDVKGVDEAKQELKDVVEFLKNPDKFSALGGKLPKGVLLVGPPGTGKTLLARAVAGEAGVPFFHAAGPEFDEILVGQGARRVRDLFKAAKERAPCVIFIDEIDSVGAKRTNSVLHPYANQTINQLLSEMDGFHQNEGVIVLGATNRREDLDKALMRPGRFDVEIFVNAPDYLGRKEILDLYLSRILTRDVDAEYLARCTTGFTGADIENMVNQAALRAAIDGADYVTIQHLERARDKVILGPEGKLRMPDDEVNRITAYHEGGHALVAYYTKDAVPLHKVTIVPRGPSLGHTSYLPEKDIYHVTKAQLLANMDTMMGGRAAEELIFGPERVTTGASKDLEDATKIAEGMVKSFGMSEKVGFRAHYNKNRDYNGSSEYSPMTNELIDSEVKRLLQESYERAKMILKTHAKEHKQLADALLKYETLDVEDVKAIANGKKTKTETINSKRPILDVPKIINHKQNKMP